MSNEAEHNKRLVSESMAFMASVIKSGQGWSEQCEHIYERAQEALNTPPSVEAGDVPDGFSINSDDPEAVVVQRDKDGKRVIFFPGLSSNDALVVEFLTALNDSPTPPVSAGGLDKEAVIGWLKKSVDWHEENGYWGSDSAVQEVLNAVERGDFDLPKQGGAQ